MGIVRPVMETYPYAWIFFVLFIVCTTFTVLNLFIGIIVSAMNADSDAAAAAERAAMSDEQKVILGEIRQLRQELSQLRSS